MDDKFDVGIIGAGPAGMNAALMLGRARKKVVIIDEGMPRNRVTKKSHGFLTRDGISPSEFRAIAKSEIDMYPSVHFVEDKALEVNGEDGAFQINVAKGHLFHTKKLLFAVGMKDLPLQIEGLSEVYGKSAFVCPYCDGWELREQPLVAIANGEKAYHFAKTLLGWTSQLTICTNGPAELSEKQWDEMEKNHINMYVSPIRQIESNEGLVQQVKLEDGTIIPCTGIFFAPNLRTGSSLPKSLGCEINETGSIKVDAFGKTSVPGVYSAGDAASELYQLIAAASSGAIAAARMNGEILNEEWENLNRTN